MLLMEDPDQRMYLRKGLVSDDFHSKQKLQKMENVLMLIYLKIETNTCARDTTENVQDLKDEEYINNNNIVMCTKKGVIKKTTLEAY